MLYVDQWTDGLPGAGVTSPKHVSTVNQYIIQKINNVEEFEQKYFDWFKEDFYMY